MRRTFGCCCRAGCGAPEVDWGTATDSTAPEGWTITGFNGNVGNSRDCSGGWNAYANSANQGELAATMGGAGRATVVYRDCWSEGFVGLYVNGALLDQTEENNAVQKTFRWCSGSVCRLTAKPRTWHSHTHAHVRATNPVSISKKATN